MVIKIIGTCNQRCLHCMQNSSPKDDRVMSMETFKKALEFAAKTKTDMVNISGGEPTMHDDIVEMLDLALSTKYKNPEVTVTLITNGLMFSDEGIAKYGVEKCNELVKLLGKHKNLKVQITNVEGLYTKKVTFKEIERNIYKSIKANGMLVFALSKVIGYFNQLPTGVSFIGRANKNSNKEVIYKNHFFDLQATKCFNMYNMLGTLTKNKSLMETLRFQGFGPVSTNVDLIEVIDLVKTNTKLSKCVPIIKENGDIAFGEYEACSKIANVYDKDTYVDGKNVLGPCGYCLQNSTQKENLDKHIKGFEFKEYCSRINESYFGKMLELRGERQ